MAFILLKRATVIRSIANSHFSSQFTRFSSSRSSTFLHGHDRDDSVTDRLHLSSLFKKIDDSNMKDCKIELVDDDTWHVSSGLADSWKVNNNDKTMKMRSGLTDYVDDDNEVANFVASNKENPDFDELEDMRIRGNLFYKIDKNSKEYEEHKFEYHGRKLSKNEKDRKGSKENKKKENPSNTKMDQPREIKKNKETKRESLSVQRDTNEHLVSRFQEVGDSCLVKKQRTLTFNQQTAPYHEPFCLDIYISTASVRASIIHRATSNVVAVSHSISKDMKFDLGSTKNKIACAAVGGVLARRALADDIHNVVYTPRKGEKLEGKLKIVLKSIIDGGVDVKVKLKQIKMRKPRYLPPRIRD